LYDEYSVGTPPFRLVQPDNDQNAFLLIHDIHTKQQLLVRPEHLSTQPAEQDSPNPVAVALVNLPTSPLRKATACAIEEIKTISPAHSSEPPGTSTLALQK
jgi:hypothetical protein